MTTGDSLYPNRLSLWYVMPVTQIHEIVGNQSIRIISVIQRAANEKTRLTLRGWAKEELVSKTSQFK